jgi:MOSC domain-containing protein YiiM
MAEVLAVCISEVRGICKHPVEQIHLIPDHGIQGDAHAGHWHRQVSLLAQESVDGMQSKITTVQLKPGDFAENVLTRGIDLKSLPVGARLRIGSALCEVTQIGKECHADCAIRQQVGDCVMPREGIFVKVLTEGDVRPGDSVELDEQA